MLRGEMRARLPGILRFPVIRPVADLEEGGTIEATLARHYALRETRREGLERRSDPSGPLQRYEITGEAWRLEWEVTRRKGEARAIVITRVTTGEDAFAVESVVLFEVTSGAIDHFLFHAASLPIEKITVNGERIRSWRPRKGETNLVELTLHAPVETRYTVSFSYLLEVPERGQEMEVPLLLPSGIDHVTGYLLIENGGFGETTIVRKEGFASERLALSDLPLLPAGVDPLDVVRVFKFFERPTIVLAVKPLRSLDLAKSVIDYVALESVVTAGGVALTRARFHLRNEREQFLGIELAEGEEIWSAKVADRPVKPLSDRTEQGRKRVLLPLVFPGAPGRTFDVEVIYRTPPPRAFSSFGRYRLEVPAVVNVPQVSKVLWTLHLPGAWHAFAFSGPFQAAGEVTLHTEELLSLVSEQKRLLYETESAQGGDRLEALRNLDELARRFTEVAGKRGRFEGAEISGGKEEVERGRLEQARRDFSRNLVRQRELTRQLAQQRASPLQGGPEVIEGWQLNAQLPEGRRFLIPQKQHSPSQLYGRRLPFPPLAKGAVRQGIESQKVEGIEPPRDVASPPPTRGGKVADAWREGGEGITHGGILPLDLSLPPGGGAFHFQKIGGGGAIEFRHLPRSWLSRGRSALDAILLVIVFLLLERHGVFRRYLPRWLARPAVHRLLFLVGLAGALFLSLSALLLWGPAWYGHGIWRRGKGGKG
ncbi:MAG: hypothetical protein D6795_15390 [Deltaproteobacteria bacterium]|nr:MAG: hypothetical protein D6795_15390 [Deltaproteobacteria bacterium]